MRELPATVALSLLAHTGAIAWWTMTDMSRVPQRAAVAAPPVELTAASPEVEVTLVAVPGDDTSVALAPRGTQRAPAPRTAIATTSRGERPPAEQPPAVEQPPVVEQPPPKRPSPFAMRTRPGDNVGSTIHRPGSDGLSDAAIAGDVPVKIANLPGAQANADYARAKARGDYQGMVAARDARAAEELTPQKDGTHTSDKTTFTARVNPDGTVDLRDKKNWKWKNPLNAEFDLTDALARTFTKGDPYAAEKLAFLDRTRAQRYEIGKRHRTTQLSASAQFMAQNLEQLWRTVRDPAERKRELFALWDDCAETGEPELVEGGREARRVLWNFIAAKRVVFTPSELAALEARKQSAARFAPAEDEAQAGEGREQ